MQRQLQSEPPPWEALFPAGVKLRGGPLDSAVPPLSIRERESAGPMNADRLAEFAQGRHHARRVLADLGCPMVELPVASDRAPIWPAGFVGSLSHARRHGQRALGGYVLAAAAYRQDYEALGIDIEYGDALSADLWKRLLTTTEATTISRAPGVDQPHLVQGLWSAKEAAIKAWRHVLDPQEIEVEVNPHTAALSIRHCVPAAGFPRLNGQLLWHGDFVIAVAVRRALQVSHTAAATEMSVPES